MNGRWLTLWGVVAMAGASAISFVAVADLAWANGQPGATVCANSADAEAFRRCIEIFRTRALPPEPPPAPAPAPTRSFRPAETVTFDGWGLALTTIGPELARSYAIPDRVDGLVVTAVADDSAAAARGLVPGDIVVEVAQNQVLSPGALLADLRAAADRGERSLLLLVYRGQGRGRVDGYDFVVLPLQ